MLPLFIQPLARRWKGFSYPALSRRSHITPPPTSTPFPSRHRNHFASSRLHPAVPLSQAPTKGLSAGRYCSGQERYQAGQHSTLLSWRPRVPRGEQRLVQQPLRKVRRRQTVPFPASFRATRTAAKPNSPGTLFICFYEVPKYFYEGFMKRCLYFSPILQNDGRPGQ